MAGSEDGDSDRPQQRRRASSFGTLGQLPSGKWRVGYTAGGRRVWKTFAAGREGKKEAQAFLAAVQTDLRRGTWTDPDAGSERFGDFAVRWLGDRHDLRPRTTELYGHLLVHHLIPTFGYQQLRAITPTKVKNWFSGLKQRLPGTAPKAYRLLAAIMRAAVDEGRIPRSPVSVKGAAKEKVEHLTVPTMAEVDALAAAVKERYRLMVLLGAWCSLRFGELAALRRDRIDLLRGEVRVRETVTELRGGERFPGPPKTAAGIRTIAIPPHLIPEVERHLVDHVGPGPDELLFPAPRGDYLARAYFRQHVWLPACRATGVQFRFHDLRHFGLTMSGIAGATVAELMYRAGHASPEAAMRYQHATQDRDRALAGLLSEMRTPAPVVPLRAVGGDDAGATDRT